MLRRLNFKFPPIKNKLVLSGWRQEGQPTQSSPVYHSYKYFSSPARAVKPFSIGHRSESASARAALRLFSPRILCPLPKRRNVLHVLGAFVRVLSSLAPLMSPTPVLCAVYDVFEYLVSKQQRRKTESDIHQESGLK